MSFRYSITLDLTGKRCAVIGGGSVALRKVNALVAAGAEVTVVSPELAGELYELAGQDKINWITDHYQDKYLAGCFLVIAATGDRITNRQISCFCKAHNILINAADSPQESSFIVNAALTRGDLVIGVSTNGRSPALARRIKEELSEVYGPQYEEALLFLSEARELAREKIRDGKVRNQVLALAVNRDVLELIKKGKNREAKEKVLECILSSWA